MTRCKVSALIKPYSNHSQSPMKADKGKRVSARYMTFSFEMARATYALAGVAHHHANRVSWKRKDNPDDAPDARRKGEREHRSPNGEVLAVAVHMPNESLERTGTGKAGQPVWPKSS